MPINHRSGNTNEGTVLVKHFGNSHLEWRPVSYKLVVALAANDLNVVPRRDRQHNSDGSDGHTLKPNVQSSGTAAERDAEWNDDKQIS